MPKKQKQKQKQKQSQKTVVSVRVGDTSKAKRTRRPRSAPAPRMPQGISLTLQGSSTAYPPPPINAYNEQVTQLTNQLRAALAQNGSLIPKAQTNDLFNRVTATNTLGQMTGASPIATLMRPEGLTEEVVEGEMNINPAISTNFSAQVPLDQDFIRNVAVSNLAQSFAGVANKIGVVEDVESISDINAYDQQNNDWVTELIQQGKARRGRQLNEDWENYLKQSEEEEKYKVAVAEPVARFLSEEETVKRGNVKEELKKVRKARKSRKPVILEEVP
jgi:hypothetical protein